MPLLISITGQLLMFSQLRKMRDDRQGSFYSSGELLTLPLYKLPFPGETHLIRWENKCSSCLK